MQLTIQSIHFNADPELESYVTRKTQKLGTFFNRIIGGQVYMKVTKPATHNNKVVEIKLMVPGDTLIASETADTFEAATDLVTEKLKSQIDKYKSKLAHK